jgi:PAS domain S-box-containing protein
MEYQFLARDGAVFIDSDLAHKGNVNLARLGLPSALVGPSPQSGYVEELHKRRHVPVVTGYAFTEGTGEFHDPGWRVLVRMDRDEVVKPIHDVAWKLGVAGALIWLPLFGLLYWATGRLRAEYEQAERESAHARAAEATLRDSEQQMRVIVETALDAVIGMDAQGRITAWNPQAETIFGWLHDDVIGRPMAETIIPPQHREAHARGVGRFLSTGQGPLLNRRIEVTALHRDGREFPVELTVTAVRLGNRWVFNAFVRDIVHRRQTEDALLQAQTQLQQAQKMEAVGRLAGGIAHDFNNLLTIITGACHFLLIKLERGNPLRKEVEEVKQAGTRAAALTSQLLAFSRRQVLRLKEIDLNEVIADIENMLERLVGEDIILVTALEPSLGLVQADPAQIEQILMNLVANARDAMPAGGRLTIETAMIGVDAAFALQHALPRPGAYVLLAVSDTGQGMDRETQAHIFEPFFTTKELGKGTGLGLATVYGSVKQSGGSIFVYSEPGQGTTFKIYLPRVGRPAAAEETPPAVVAALPRGTETVLVVEDEPGVRAVILRTLRDLGYTVLEARHGLEALHLGSQPLAKIHLLLTDVVMPQVSGREVAENLSQLHPALKVLYMSGYTDDAVVRHGILSDGMPFLQKPFTPDMLAQKVREVLDLPRVVS